MLRHVASIALLLALASAPTALVAQGHGGTAEIGGITDPNGAVGSGDLGTGIVTTNGACELDTCGEIGGVIDPDGAAAPARTPAAPARPAPTSWLDWLRILFFV